MKDLVSCFSEHAVRISGGASAAAGPAEGSGGCRGRAVMNAVTSVYRSRLSASGKDLLIDVTWSLSPDGPVLSVAVHDAASRHRAGGPAAAPRHLHKKKGSSTFTAGSCVVDVFWDYAAARYGAGPEPVSGFYVAVVADAEFVILLGDMSRGYVERLHGGIPIAGSRMARRRERFVGCGCWSTKARFLESGAEHEIGVRLEGDAEGWVSVDGRKVVQLRRLLWSFRGSHTLFLDGGAPVDMTWDLHGWLFHAAEPTASSSCAVFTFQARGTSERLWMEDDDENNGDDEQENEKPPAPDRSQRLKLGGGAPSGQGFCLLIQGFMSSSKIT